MDPIPDTLNQWFFFDFQHTAQYGLRALWDRVREYSVSNRGLRPGLVGTAEQVKARIAEFHAVGVDLLLLQMSPQLEEMERFAARVIPG